MGHSVHTTPTQSIRVCFYFFNSFISFVHTSPTLIKGLLQPPCTPPFALACHTPFSFNNFPFYTGFTFQMSVHHHHHTIYYYRK